jgi:uncharacterized protein with FMN-binding domain
MRRAIVVLGTTAAGLAALFSYKSHVAGVAVASTSPTRPTVTAAPDGSALAASAWASPSPSKSATKKSTPKPKPTPTPTKTTATAAPPSQQPAAPATTPAPTKSSAPAGPSGTFTGSDENTQYGDVQVQLTVANGKITDANDVQQPSDSIGSNAVSQLNQEVLTAQSANIQAVSGATYTSQGYIGSLQQALNKAGI